MAPKTLILSLFILDYTFELETVLVLVNLKFFTFKLFGLSSNWCTRSDYSKLFLMHSKINFVFDSFLALRTLYLTFCLFGNLVLN